MTSVLLLATVAGWGANWTVGQTVVVPAPVAASLVAGGLGVIVSAPTPDAESNLGKFQNALVFG